MKKIFFIANLCFLGTIMLWAQPSKLPCSINELIVLQNENLSTTKSVSAVNIIANTIVVKNGGNLTCSARETILLQGGFKVETGGTFKAQYENVQKRDDRVTLNVEQLYSVVDGVQKGYISLISSYNGDTWHITLISRLGTTITQEGTFSPSGVAELTDFFSNKAIGRYYISIYARNVCGKTSATHENKNMQIF